MDRDGNPFARVGSSALFFRGLGNAIHHIPYYAFSMTYYKTCFFNNTKNRGKVGTKWAQFGPYFQHHDRQDLLATMPIHHN